MAIGTDIALDSAPVTTNESRVWGDRDGDSMTSQPSTAVAVMAGPGSIIGPTRLVFKMARQWHAKMRQEASHTTPDHEDATMMRIMATAAFTATRALTGLNTRTAIGLATNRLVAATKLL
jgi:hypothetical protein